MIPEALDGKRIAITGGTGFLGTALVERLLRSVPGCELVLLVRPGKRSTVAQRAKREIFRNDAFDRLRAELGKDELRRGGRPPGAGHRRRRRHRRPRPRRGRPGRARRRATSSSTRPPRSPSTRRSTARSRSTCSAPAASSLTLQDLGVTPHLVAVSTCYVAGNRRGAAPEEPVHDSPFFVDVDWRAEVDGRPPGPRSDAEAESRTPEALAGFRAEAVRELGAAGTPGAGRQDRAAPPGVGQGPHGRRRPGPGRVARLARRLRLHQGARRAGAARSSAATSPCRIVRPSIIESALAEPRPGWIRGFRMAEPVIICYARGLLKEFPGVPEGIVDVIPVDLVVAAVIDAAAGGPPDRARRSPRWRRARSTRCATASSSTWCASGSPSTRSTTARASPSSCPTGRSPGAAGSSASSSGPSRRSTGPRPCCSRCRCGASRPSGRPSSRRSATRPSGPSGYVELYGAYAECEAIYGVDRLLARCERLDDADQAAFCFDPRVIDWTDLRRTTSTCRRSSTTPGCAPRPAGARARTAPIACAARCSPPSATSPRSTSRTR